MSSEQLKDIRRGILDSLPILTAYFPLGVVWGVLWEQSGLPPLWGILYSTTIYAGAVQFLALPFVVNGGEILSLLLAAIPVAMRNSFYTVAMLRKLPTGPLWRFYSAFALVDAPFAILVNRTKEECQNLWYLAPHLIFVHSYWVLGTALGVWAGGFIPDHFDAIGFALPALIILLAEDQRRKAGSWQPVWIALMAAVGSYFVVGSNWMFPAIIACALWTIFKKEEVEA